MKRFLMMLGVLGMLVVPAWAGPSYYHIPASACRGVSGTSTNCKGAGNACFDCVAAIVGNDHKPVWTCTNIFSNDQGIECEFSLPPFATSVNIMATPIFSDNGTTGSAGFYGFFEVTPLGQAFWSLNLGQACAASTTATANLPALHGGADNSATITIRTCNEATNAYCDIGANPVSACAGTTGYHGKLVIYRDNSTFAPNLNESVDISEIIVRVETP
jgi:hypothetical protein